MDDSKIHLYDTQVFAPVHPGQAKPEIDDVGVLGSVAVGIEHKVAVAREEGGVELGGCRVSAAGGLHDLKSQGSPQSSTLSVKSQQFL